MEWLAKRTASFDSSGIRRVFDLASKMESPINLSIGQPDFDVPERVKAACIAAIQEGKNGYTPTQGLPRLVQKLQDRIAMRWNHSDRKAFVTSGTSGALFLALCTLVDPGDEVIIFDPYFVMYEPLVHLVGGVPVIVDTHPDFRIDPQRVADVVTSRTKLIVLNSPSNPTGVIAERPEVEGLARLAADNRIALISDEIYQQFCYAPSFVSPAEFNDRTIVIDGFSKSHGMTGWRLGFAHGPATIIEAMAKLQQYSFVCAPQPSQWAGIEAMDSDVSGHVDTYAKKRDRIVAGLSDDFEIVKPDGAFYAYPKAPWGTGTQFVEAAIQNNVLIIPGNIFSRHDTHFRISYASSDEQLDRGIEALVNLARQGKP